MPYLCCFDEDELQYVLWEVHESVCGNNKLEDPLPTTSFKVSYLVFRKVTLNSKETRVGSLSSTCEGFYKVIKTIGPGTYNVEDADKKELKHP